MSDPLVDLVQGVSDQNGPDPLVSLVSPQGASAPVQSASIVPKQPMDTNLTLGERAVSALPKGVQDWLQHPTLPGVGYIGAGSPMHGYAMGAADPVVGLGQMAANIPGAPSNSVNQAISDKEAQYQSDRAAAGRSGFDASRLAGNIAGPASLTAMKFLPASPTTLTQAALQGAGTGAVFGAAAPVTNPDDYWTQKATQVGTGAVAGGVASPGALALSKMLAPSIAPGVKTLMDAGVTPTPGQILGGGFRRTEDAMTSIPVLGDMVKNAQRRSAVDLNTAAINRSLSPIGDSLPAGTTGRAAIDYAVTKLSGAYDSVLNKVGAVKVDPQFASEIGNLSVLTQNLPKDTADQFGRIIQNEITARVNPKGFMTSEAMKSAESNLGSIARNYMKSPDYDQRTLGTAVVEAQSTLRNLLVRQSPDNAKELSAINTGYANLLRAQRASSSVGAEDGVFSAAQLQNAVKALDSSRNKRAFATGNALMQDLSDSAKNVMGSSVPDSGTPFRHAVQAGAAGLVGHSMLPAGAGGLMIPAAGGMGLLSLPYTKLGQQAAAAALTQRPEWARTMGQLVARSAPFAGIPVSQAALSSNP